VVDLAVRTDRLRLQRRRESCAKETVRGQASDLSLVFVPIGGDVCIPAMGAGDHPGPEATDSDAAALAEDCTTVTSMEPDMTAYPSDRSRLESVIADLDP
jgi:hypothetical protein